MGRTMTRPKAWLIGFGIFSYFSIATVWLPSELLKGTLGSKSPFLQDLVTVSVWGFFLLLGFWGLRTAQRRGLI